MINIVFKIFLLYNYYGDNTIMKKQFKIIFIIIIFIIGVVLYSRYMGIKGLKVKEYSVIDNLLPKEFYGIKIVQISDIHYKNTTNKKELEKIVSEINKLKPDIVLLNGDLLSKNIKYTEKDFKDIINTLNKIKANIGSYAIKGEEDLGFKNWEQIINDSNFINLNDKYEEIYYNGINPILLIGISSNYKNDHIKEEINSIYEKLDKNYKFSILMLHEPDFIDKINYNKFNLIFAGHTHKGQVYIPLIGGILKNKYSKYNKDFYKLQNTKLYISSGIGTNKFKFRFLNKPSISIFRLRNK